ncbi:hypothetical protein AAVH_14921 [Aphelenchoides avenae]|nr:hypothetical protein AAVH_14921 [Aphelenchus avenae]
MRRNPALLSNSHVADLKTPYSDGRFTLKMLAALVADHNCTMDRLRMGALDGQLTDYRSMDVVFGGGMRLNGLTELKFLEANPTFGRPPTRKPWPRRQQAILGSPLWLTGIHLLRNCALYEVHCDGSKSHLESIALKLVELCEKFERVENMKIRERFEFKAPRDFNFPFNEGNQVSASERIGCGGPGAGRRLLTLYRFRNAATGKWLSAIVGHKTSNGSVASILHITKGKASPEAIAIDF